MLAATPSTLQHEPPLARPDADQPDTIETRLWLQEHDWLYDLLKSDRNVAPTFRFPDLISACVSVEIGRASCRERVYGRV